MAGAKMGRPTLYSEELAERICDLVSISECGLKKLCDAHDWMPDRDTINTWRFKNDDFSARYDKAKRNQAEIMMSTIMDIADDSANDYIIDEDGNKRINSELVNRSRLRIDTRKFLAMKLLPKLYGEKPDSGAEGNHTLVEMLLSGELVRPEKK